MATVKKLVITCDRHGGLINEDTEFLHLDVTPGKKTRGRTSHQKLDLCTDCAKDFAEFMEGKADGKA
jgi:hypothetical protein